MRINRVPLIKSVQRVTFSEAAATGLHTYTQTIARVLIDRTLVMIINMQAGYYASASLFWSYFAGADLLDPSTVRLNVNAQAVGTPAGVIARVEIIELMARPRSLQALAGNSDTSQTISTVDPTKAIIVPAYQMATLAGESNNPTLEATRVLWTAATDPAYRWQVAQFN